MTSHACPICDRSEWVINGRRFSEADIIDLREDWECEVELRGASAKKGAQIQALCEAALNGDCLAVLACEAEYRQFYASEAA